MKRILFIAGLLGVLLVVGLSAAWWWLTTTRDGAVWLLERAGVERLEWERIEGGLSGGIVLANMRLEEGAVRLTAESVELAGRVRPGFPLRVKVYWLRVRDADLHLPPAPDEPVDADPFRLQDFTSTIDWVFDEIELREIRVHPPTGEVIEIRRLALAGRYGRSLTLDRVELELPDFTFNASGEWALRAPWSVILQAEAVYTLGDGSEQRLSLDAIGPFADITSDVHAEGPFEARGNVRVTGLPQAPDITLVVTGSAYGWPGLEGTLEDVNLTLTGRPHDWHVDAGFEFEWPDLPRARAHMEAAGDLERVDLRRLDIDTLDGRIEARGTATRLPQPGAELSLRLHDLDFTSLYPDWPDQARLSGGMELAWDGSLSLRDIQLHAPPSELAVSGWADLDPRADRLEAELVWRHFTWPPVLDGQPPLVFSESGQLRASGRLSDWRLELETLLRVPDRPQIRLDLRASGDSDGAEIERAVLRLADGDGGMDVRGNLAWTPHWRGALSIEVRDFDPAILRPELPGSIAADVELEFALLEPLALRLELENLEGTVRGQEVSGRGGGVLGGTELEQGRLELTLGSNRLELASPDGDTWEMQFDAPALDQLWPDISGQATFNGELLFGEGLIRFSGHGEALGFGDLRLESIELDGSARWRDEERMDLTATLLELDLNPWERFDGVGFEFAGNCDNHRLELNLSGTRGSLDLAADGALPNCLDAPLVWNGRLERLYLGDTLAGDWHLDGELPVHYEAGGMTAGPGCLDAVATPGRLCLEVFETAPDPRAGFALEAVPADLLLLAFDPVFTLDSLLDGRLELRWDDQGAESVIGEIGLGPGALRGIASEEELLVIEEIRLELTSPAARALEARFEAAMEGDSRVTGRAWTGDLRAPAEMIVEADGRLDLPELGAFNRLFPELDQLGGRLTGELELAGPVTGPDFTGRLALRDGLVTYAPIGLKLTEIHADLDAVRGRGNLTGGFRAGAGEGSIEGRLVREDASWLLEVMLAGEDLQVSDLDWLELAVSPDLSLALRPQQMELNGDIVIGRARIGLPPGTEDRVSESADVVILGEEELEPELRPARALSGTVNLKLGDDVRLNAAGMRTRLTGDVGLIWSAGAARPRGRGVIRMAGGTYRALGQNLAVESGQVIFTGHPLDNPRLDIRTVREIYGDMQVEKAGVRIVGPARDPRVELFTDPPTTEEKALAYIITGAAFDPSAGQGAYNVGFYLLPKLFVSYGLGLFETDNMLSARYEFSRRWGVRVTSGERDSGAEIGFLHDR